MLLARKPSRPLLYKYLTLLMIVGAYLATIFGYTLLIESYGSFGTHQMLHPWVELGLLLYFFGLLYSLQKPSAWRALLAGAPILLLYLVCDIFFLAQGNVFRLINISELPELLQVIPTSYAILAIAVMLLVLLVVSISLEWRRPLQKALWLSPFSILALFILYAPNAFIHTLEKLSVHIVKYSDSSSVETNGRLTMVLYREAQRVSALDQLAPYRNREGYNKQLTSMVDSIKASANGRNVHMIVLESFFDPRLFDRLQFSSSPVHPDFESLFGDKLSLSISPVFGGGTAQAEFELLCGMPAFGAISSVEFNAFNGSAANCLPKALASMGYRSVASNAYKPNFFNAIPGYKGTGFDEAYFPQEFSGVKESYLHFGKPGDEKYIFDSELFRQNFNFVKNHIEKKPDQPLFNYMMTSYGHTPHILNPELRPRKIKLKSSFRDDHLDRATNQIYYRTKAIARFVRQLIKLDKNSLIILISDHVPPLRNGLNTYKELGYMGNIKKNYYYNRLAIIENGKVKQLPTMRHYEMPSLILDSISNGEYCKRRTCDFRVGDKRRPRVNYFEDYMKLMSNASE